MFDLDPPGSGFDQARHAALALRALLDELELPSQVKTSGSRGLHVSVPIGRRHEPEQVHEFACAVCDVLSAREPERYTNEFRKAKRRGRLYLDVSRNVYAQLVVAPYTVRAKRGAPVATPLDWERARRQGSATGPFHAADHARPARGCGPVAEPAETGPVAEQRAAAGRGTPRGRALSGLRGARRAAAHR